MNFLRLNNLKTEQVTGAKLLEFVLYVEEIIYLLLYNLHDCTFKGKLMQIWKSPYKF